MISYVVEDLNGNKVEEVTTHFNEFKYNFSSDKLFSSNVLFEPFLNKLDYAVVVLDLDFDKKDYLICFANSFILDYYNLDLDEVKGRFLFESVNFIEEFKINEQINESYDNDENLEFKLLIYLEDILLNALVFKCFRFDDKLYISIHKSSDFTILVKSNNESIKHSKWGVGIIQFNKWVYGNETFCKVNNCLFENLDELPIINPYIDFKYISHKELSDIINNILNRKLLFYEVDFDLKKGDTQFFYKKFFIPTSYNNKPAVKVVIIDVTKEKVIENEITDLKNTVNQILKLSKVAIYKVKDGNIYWSNEIYPIFEVFPSEVNFEGSVKDINSYFYKYDKFLIDDYLKIANEVSKQINEESSFNIRFTIKSRDGNYKNLIWHFISYSHDIYNGVGYIQDVSSDKVFSSEFNQIFNDYSAVVDKLSEYDSNLKIEFLKNKHLLKKFYKRINVGLNLLISLSSDDLDKNSVDFDVLIDRIKSISQMLFFTNKIWYNLDYLDYINLKEFIINFFIDVPQNIKSTIDINLDDLDEKLDISTDTLNLICLSILEIILEIFQHQVFNISNIKLSSSSDDEFTTFVISLTILNNLDFILDVDSLTLDLFLQELNGNYEVFIDDNINISIKISNDFLGGLSNGNSL